MRKINQIVAYMALFLAAGVPSLIEAKPTILAMGDSITEGSSRFTCYRQVLVPELKKKNIPFAFIGPKKDRTSAHAGYSGKNTKFLLEQSKKIYSKYPADIVLLHSGHNSFAKDKPVPGIVKDTQAIIENMHEINPKVKVLLAQVITAGKLPKYSYIPDLNKELEVLAKQMKGKGINVVLVNHSAGFDWKTDTTKDKVHPNASGAKKMAEKWMKALEPLLVHPEKGVR